MKAHEIAQQILGFPERERSMELRIVVQSQGGIGGTASAAISSAQAGIDWDHGKLLLYPEKPLTTLSPQDVAAIVDSVRKGGSWHAYQQWKKQDARIKALEAELKVLKGQA